MYVSLLFLCHRSHCSLLTLTETRNTKGQLTMLTTLLTQLQSDVNDLKTNVNAVKDRLSVTINKPACAGCSGLSSAEQDLTLELTVSVSADRTRAHETLKTALVKD